MPRPASLALRLRYTVSRKDGTCVARCPFLDVVGEGASESEAVARMKEELAVLLDFCAERGTLAQVLAHRSTRYSPPVSLLRDLRIESAAFTPAAEIPDWALLSLDPASLPELMHGLREAGTP